MLTALVLQLIQCVTYLPDKIGANKNPNLAENEESGKDKMINVSLFCWIEITID